MNPVSRRFNRIRYAENLQCLKESVCCFIQIASDVGLQVFGDYSLHLLIFNQALHGVDPVIDAPHFMMCQQTFTVSDLIDFLSVEPDR